MLKFITTLVTNIINIMSANSKLIVAKISLFDLRIKIKYSHRSYANKY